VENAANNGVKSWKKRTETSTR